MLVICWVAMLVACLGYGAASVLQSAGAKAPTDQVGRFLAGGRIAAILTQLPYLAGLALDTLAFVGNVVALQRLPLYLVQAVVNGSVGVTALIAWRRGQPVSRMQWWALAALGVGLTLLALSSGSQPPGRLPPGAAWVVFAAGVIPLGLTLIGLRLSGAVGPTVLALAAGLAFSGVAVAARALRIPPHWYALLGSPLLWTILAHGILGVVVFAVALQRGAVTAVTAITFVVELIVPTAFGLALLGDRVRPSWLPAAVAGFGLTVVATVVLARFAESDVDVRPSVSKV